MSLVPGNQIWRSPELAHSTQHSALCAHQRDWAVFTLYRQPPLKLAGPALVHCTRLRIPEVNTGREVREELHISIYHWS